MLLRRRLRLARGLLALGAVALFAAVVHPPSVGGDKSGSQQQQQQQQQQQHNLESHQHKDSRKCLLTAAVAASGCVGKRTVVVKRHADKRQHGGGGSDRDNDLDRSNNFDYNYYDGGGGDGRFSADVGQDDGGAAAAAAENAEEYFDQPLITDPRDRMLPVIYNPRPMYVPPVPPPPPPQVVSAHHQQQQQQQHPSPQYNNRYDEDVPHPRISQFEVPIIECPPTEDGFERFACPSPDKEGRFRCIDDHVLCDGYIDCPNGDDEDRKNCFFFKTTKAHLDILADALLRWARGR